MYVCMYVCMYVYIYTYIYAYTYEQDFYARFEKAEKADKAATEKK
jgi:hypothetical protein